MYTFFKKIQYERGVSLNKPLSFINYFKNNTKRNISLVAVLSFSIMMIVIFDAIAYGVQKSSQWGDVSTVKNLTKIYVGESSESYEAVLKQIQKMPQVERMVRVRTQNMDYLHMFGTCNVQTFFVSKNDLNYLMEKMQVSLIEGRIPSAPNEIILTEYLAKNKGKWLGDKIGKTVDATEKMPGEYVIVGILKGECIVGLGINASDEDPYSNYLVVPRKGQLNELNQALSSFHEDELQLWDLGKAVKNDLNNQTRLNAIFDTIAVALLFVIAFGIGNASYAHYFSRRYEFGLLQSIGYTKNSLLLRVAKEIGLFCIISLGIGLLSGVGINVFLDKVFFDPKGYPSSLLQMRGIIKVMSIPAATAAFGIIPSAWLLTKVDPMIVIEKFEG